MLSHFSRVGLFVTLWTVAREDSLGKNTGVGCTLQINVVFSITMILSQ